jgi:hypothetical protein
LICLQLYLKPETQTISVKHFQPKNTWLMACFKYLIYFNDYFFLFVCHMFFTLISCETVTEERLIVRSQKSK